MRSCLSILVLVATAAAAGPALAQSAATTAERGNGFKLRIGDFTARAYGLNSLSAAPAEATTGTSLPGGNSFSLDAGYRVWRTWGIVGRYATSNRFTAPSVEALPGRSLGSRDESFALGVAKSETWLRGDRLSLTVGQPGRDEVTGFGAPPAGSGFGSLLRDLPGVGLRAPGRDVSTELSYFAPITKSAGLGLSVVNRTRQGFEGPRPDERAVSIRFSSEF